jgi:cysteine-rich repeat protein
MSQKVVVLLLVLLWSTAALAGGAEGSSASWSGQTGGLSACVVPGFGVDAWPRCGDGVLQGGEFCDDGNQAAGDGCSATCAREVGGDRDLDGLRDEDEARLGTDPGRADSDGDGLCDGSEVVPGVCVGGEFAAAWQDSDLDGRLDALDPDDDGDGVLTREELGLVCRMGTLDVDRDGLPAWRDRDTDGDQVEDGDEVAGDPDQDGLPAVVDGRDQDGPEGDLDQDGLSNAQEARLGTRPLRSDSDGDGLPDGLEAPGGWGRDQDGDGRIDALDVDSDNDRVSDAVEGREDANEDGVLDYLDAAMPALAGSLRAAPLVATDP